MIKNERRHISVKWITDDDDDVITATAMHPVLLGSTYKLHDVITDWNPNSMTCRLAG